MGPFKNYVALRGEGVRLSVTRCDKGDSLKRYVTLLTLLRSGSCCTFFTAGVGHMGSTEDCVLVCPPSSVSTGDRLNKQMELLGVIKIKNTTFVAKCVTIRCVLTT